MKYLLPLILLFLSACQEPPQKPTPVLDTVPLYYLSKPDKKDAVKDEFLRTSLDSGNYENLTANDKVLFFAKLQEALEKNRTGEPLAWLNKASQFKAVIVPMETYRNGTTANCRYFHLKIWQKDQISSSEGSACRNDKGGWVMNHEK